MRLYIMQHGDAVPEDVDPDRPLSEKGRRDVERLKDFLAERELRVSRVFHSGKTRARETVELLLPVVLPGGAPEVAHGLNPRDDPESCLAWVTGLGGDVLVVSHKPLVGRVVNKLVTERESIDCVSFSPGTMVALESEDPTGPWQILFALPPMLLGND